MKRALIIDVSSIVYRSYYKLLNMSSSKGFPTGALYGLVNVIQSLMSRFNPEYVVACLDSSRSSLKRREKFPDYKSNRDFAPDQLAMQISRVEGLLNALGIFTLKRDGYEADDLIFSSLQLLNKGGIESYVVTGDKDLMQLVPEAKIILQRSTGEEIIDSSDRVKEILGVYPNQIRDLFALQGDSSDGIPGVKGIGPKGAIKLISSYGNLDEVYSNIDDLADKLKEKLLENREIAYISRDLATLEGLDCRLTLDEIKRRDFSSDLIDILTELEFRSIIKKLNLGREDETEDIVKVEVEKYKLSQRTTLIYEKGSFYIYEKENNIEKKDIDSKNKNSERVIVTKEIDFNNQIVDTYNAKEMYKKGIEFNLGIDAAIGYHLLTSERSKLDKIILRLLNLEVKDIALSVKYLDAAIIEIKHRLIKEELVTLYETIERPFIEVLARMECTGAAVDVEGLKLHKKELEIRIGDVSKKIEHLAGEEFNISSPKQLSHILFTKLGLPKIKKIKSGYSTDVEVLKELSGYKIVKHILEYRELTKLYTTYVVSLLKLEIDGRIHTTYHQDGTATGRLSSSNPNLQNIPSHSLEGLKVKRSFISHKSKLLSLDYSQIELRILAFLSKDKELIRSYENNLDLHYLTAKKIFNRDKISKNERNKAKIVNFSLIYGKSAFGLSKEIGISIFEASSYISRYFEQYPGVKRYIEDTISYARSNGYVKTLFGRKRYLKDINNRNSVLRSASERMAVNSVIQGTQSEIIKKAMIEIDRYIKDKDICMTMQVHDELIFEIETTDHVKDLINIMENSCSLGSVPIVVNKRVSNNWVDES